MLDLHLKKLEIQGFKSFADKIEIDFKEGITAIVGPNGSGKSNISDAIRWVLGEQSVKTLRGSKMEDIIFSGTDIRKALGYAEVSIIFDNKDGVIPLDYQEVAITRRMFRSGESEYYINKNSCRLKDIKEIFMDTGVGKDGYSIIGQGKVDEILSSRPEDRRNIFEEAAGIVKYKSKKEASEKKLEKTKENLIRIEDIIGELQKQLEYLKEQSEKAKEFLELSGELKSLEVNLFIRKIEEIENSLKLYQEEKEKLQLKIDSIVEDKSAIENKSNLMKEEIESLENLIHNMQSEKLEILNELNQKKSDVEILKEKRKFHIKDGNRLDMELKELSNEKNKNINRKNILEKEILKLEEELESLKNGYKDKNENLVELNKKIEISEKNIEVEKSSLMNNYNLIADKKSKINNMVSFEENISNRIRQLEREIEKLKIAIDEDMVLIEEIEKIEVRGKDEILNFNRSIAQLKLEEKEYQENLNNLYGEINKNKVKLQGNISNYNLLKNMEEDYEGYYKSVKNLMLRCKNNEMLDKKLIGIVVDLIKVEEKYEKAIDVALGGSLQNIVTANEEDAKFLIDYLRENKLGRITFLPLTTIKGNLVNISVEDRNEYNILGLGSELINYDIKYKNIMEYLLGRTIVVEDLQDAIAVARRFNYRFRITTLEGDILNPGGSMTGGSMPKISGNLLNRKTRLENLKTEINQLSFLQNSYEVEKREVKSKLEEIVEELKLQNEKLQNLNIDVVKIENDKNKYLEDIDRNYGFIDKYNEEIESLSLELNNIIKNKAVLKEESNKIEEENILLKENIEKLLENFSQEKTIRDDFLNHTTDLKLEINSLENKIHNLKEEFKKTDTKIHNMEIEKNEKLIENQNNQEEIKYIINKITELEKNMELLTQKEVEKNNEYMALKTQKDKLMEDYYLKQKDLKEINESLNEYEKANNNWNVKEAKHKVQLDNINGKLLEDYELYYDEALELWKDIEDLDGAKTKVNKLRREIRKIGTVDLSSIEEYELVSERFSFMSRQHRDLLEAKSDLQKVIVDMEEKMTEQFLYNFDLINKEFNSVFSILFDGGKAELKLEDVEDVLNCGIEINAQPPGKKLQNLTLLSGGEKSLTAVALLFAILQIKPTPFCILDEIDAALDEANINRYTNYLKSLSDETQFIMITHRKGTMEMADILYGVTMEEEGISKIISVKLTDDLEEIAS